MVEKEEHSEKLPGISLILGDDVGENSKWETREVDYLPKYGILFESFKVDKIDSSRVGTKLVNKVQKSLSKSFSMRRRAENVKSTENSEGEEEEKMREIRESPEGSVGELSEEKSEKGDERRGDQGENDEEENIPKRGILKKILVWMRNLYFAIGIVTLVSGNLTFLHINDFSNFFFSSPLTWVSNNYFLFF